MMDYAYSYQDPSRLYLNVTNRCTNRCNFCVRNHRRGLGGADLWGGTEPNLQQLLAAVAGRGGIEAFAEFIWCGFGEPTFRLDLILEASRTLRSKGALIRLNTNGHACLIHSRDVLPELATAVDSVSISLNAPNKERYLDLCLPDTAVLGSLAARGAVPARAGQFWDTMLDFLRRAPDHFAQVQASIVAAVLTDDEIQASAELARSLGVSAFRTR